MTHLTTTLEKVGNGIITSLPKSSKKIASQVRAGLGIAAGLGALVASVQILERNVLLLNAVNNNVGCEDGTVPCWPDGCC